MATTYQSRTGKQTENGHSGYMSLESVRSKADSRFVKERYDRSEDRSFTGLLKSIAARDDYWIGKNYNTGYELTKGPIQVNKSSSLVEASGLSGGYIVPPDFTAKLMKTFAENSFIYNRALIVPMGSSTTACPVVDAVTAPSAAGISPFFGTVQMKWGSEQSPNETEPAWKEDELHAWDLLGVAVASNQWFWDLQSSPLAEMADKLLFDLFAKAAAWYAEYAFLQGTGSAALMPQGMLNANCAVSVTRKTSSQINSQDIANMAANLLPSSWSRAIWLSSPTAVAQIAQIAQYTINRPEWDASDINQVNCRAGAIMARPWYVTEKLPAMGTPGDLMLIDPSMYVVGDRQQIIVDASIHPNFRNNQIMFRTWTRLDGRCLLSGAVTLQDTTSKVSSVVYLK